MSHHCACGGYLYFHGYARMGSVHSNDYKCERCGAIYEIDDGYGDYAGRNMTLITAGKPKPQPQRPTGEPLYVKRRMSLKHKPARARELNIVIDDQELNIVVDEESDVTLFEDEDKPLHVRKGQADEKHEPIPSS